MEHDHWSGEHANEIYPDQGTHKDHWWILPDEEVSSESDQRQTTTNKRAC